MRETAIIGAAILGVAGIMMVSSSSRALADPEVGARRAPAHGPRHPPARRLVRHPAWNFACQSPYYLSGGRRCDHPVWVYGSPCEIDLGWRRWKPCR